MNRLTKQAESYTPPPAVAAAAARGLALRESASPSNKGGLTVSQAHQQGIGSGVQRAVDLKNRRALSAQTVRRMHAFFSRHEKNKAIDPGKTPAQDKGHQAWLLWGGDPGKVWADGIVAGMNKKAAAAAGPSKKPSWFPKAILGGAILGATHGAIRPHSAFSGGMEAAARGLGHSVRQRAAGALVGSTVGAGLGWMPQIVYEGTRSPSSGMRKRASDRRANILALLSEKLAAPASVAALPTPRKVKLVEPARPLSVASPPSPVGAEDAQPA